MQIIITLKPIGTATLPLNYNYRLQGLIYSLLSGSPAYSAFLHDLGYSTGGNKFKMFTFGGIKGDCHIENKMLHITGLVSVEIRSISEKFCDIVKKALLSSGTVRIGSLDFEIRMTEVYDKRIEDAEINIITASPIVARQTTDDGKTVYHAPDDPVFQDCINYNYGNKFEAYTGAGPEYGIRIEPSGKIRKVVTNFKGI